MFVGHRGNIGGVAPAGRATRDVDPRSGGLDSLERYAGQHGSLPWTPTRITGGGGPHYDFIAPLALS